MYLPVSPSYALLEAKFSLVQVYREGKNYANYHSQNGYLKTSQIQSP